MGTSSERVMRKLVIILLLMPFLSKGQQPFINSVSPTHVEIGDTVNITGNNLGVGTKIFFGTVEANTTRVSDNLIKASVPAGATNAPLTALFSGSVVQSSQQFFISFGGSTASSWDTEHLQALGLEDAYDVCLCDIDQDGLNDVIMSHNAGNDGGTELSVLENLSTPGAESFSPVAIGDNPDNSRGFISTTCADLNNDGYPEAIFTVDGINSGNQNKQVFIYANPANGSMALTYNSSLEIPDEADASVRVPRRVKAADMNGDGLKDLVVGNVNDNTLHIFENLGGLSFADGANSFELSFTSIASSGALDIADLDNDGKQDIIVVPAGVSNQPIAVFRNTSTPDDFSFSQQAGISTSDTRRNVVIGDFDNDGLNDFAVTADRTIGSVGDERVVVFENTTSGSTITFSQADVITVSSNLPWGIDAGDINGDGFLDLVVASVGGSGTPGSLFTIENGASGTINFPGSGTALGVSIDARNIGVGDLDGDAKPDVAYSHNITLDQSSDLGVQLNTTCIDPEIAPATLSFCAGTPFTVEATNSTNSTYTWSIQSGTGTVDGGASPSVTTSNFATFNISSMADATIRVQIDQGGCSTTQDLAVVYSSGGITTTPTIEVVDADVGDICAGDQVTIRTQNTYEEYLWTLPDGSTSISDEIVLSSITTADAGEYTVSVANPGSNQCASVTVSQNIEVKQLPILEISNSNLDNFCAGSTITLEAPDYTADFTYEWRLDGTPTGDGSVASIMVNTGGNYTVAVTDASTCESVSAQYTVTEIDPPTSVIATGPSTTCTSFVTDFTSNSSGASCATCTLQYRWIIDDQTNGRANDTLTTQDIGYAFPEAGTYNVILQTYYPASEVYTDSDVCFGSDQLSVTVTDAPTITFSQADTVFKCQAESINIEVTSAGISSYQWSTVNASADTVINANVSTESSFDFSTPIGIDSMYVIVDVVTDVNCDIRDTVLVINFPTDIDISSPDFDASTDVITLEEDNFVSLTAENVTNPVWRPNEIMNDSTAAMVRVFPNQPSTTITLIGTDGNGCTVASTIEIILDNIRPKRTFSPNGDGLNDCWEILNSSQTNTAGCKAYVFDSRGRNIFVGDAPFTNNCVWDGNFNGTPVPEGVYYFVFKCDDDNMSKTGSILLAR